MSLERLSLSLFICAAIGLVHAYFFYPLSLRVLNPIVGSPLDRRTEPLPSVALIIAAYNEEDVIHEKIENSLELEYPSNKLNIIVFSDASSDRTDEIVKEYESEGVTLIRIEGRVGKTECQNRVTERVDEEILVFSDANSMYEPNAITELVHGFTPEVGCVVGELRYRDSSDVEGESFYWRYESRIKSLESEFHSLVTGNGSIYAVRTSSYVPQPPDRISDFTEPLSIIRNGERVRYVPSAVAWEETGSSPDDELSRRIRIVTRSWNSIIEYTDLLNPLQDSKIAYQLISHKVIRWLSPLLLMVALGANVGLVLSGTSISYEIALAGQIAFYMLAGLGGMAEQFGVDDPLITHVPFYFLYANYGMLRGFLNFVNGSNIVVWETTDR
ncbi:glycosyl transferase [Haloarcula mannanilytica]|uniref:Glycosyl transferase n=1 Tax=Haloarcula mannanilytica TaxID=2509225 RepID=A0A4C2EJF4_9EURY|nr:glycosyltransferase family 2 protein [Haloarcula mannanilytica]GCF14476.1 glycosyl transferase [Haloarcula mannanilytica]